MPLLTCNFAISSIPIIDRQNIIKVIVTNDISHIMTCAIHFFPFFPFFSFCSIQSPSPLPKHTQPFPIHYINLETAY